MPAVGDRVVDTLLLALWGDTLAHAALLAALATTVAVIAAIRRPR